MAEVTKVDQSTNALIIKKDPGLSDPTAVRIYNYIKDLIDSAVFFEQVLQATGTSLTDTMSQGAITDALGLVGGGSAIRITYNDVPDMLADQANQLEGRWYRALDASDDPLVTSGWAIYEYLGVATASLDDYYFILDQESLNLVVQDATPTVKGIVKLFTTTGTGTDGTIDQNTITTLLAAKVAANSAITGATKTKITYDSKGLVTSGADATQDDIGDGSTYKQYSSTEKTKLAAISGTNTGDQTITLTGDVTGSGTGSFATTVKNKFAISFTFMGG
jgi:hypothetical protein